MSEHLAIVSAPTLRGLLRRRTMTWKRRRRDAPIGRVRPSDRVFFKLPGGPVVATSVVSRVREERRGGRYMLTLRFRVLHKLTVPFPVLKRDRRSWIVCAPPPDERQQRLLAGPDVTLRGLLRAVHAGGQRRLPSRRAATALLARLARQRKAEGSLLLWLALLAALSEGDRLVEVVQDFSRKPARRVVPFALFS